MSTLMMNQLSQMEYITTIIDWMKPDDLSVIVFLPLDMAKFYALQLLFFPKKCNFILKTTHSFNWIKMISTDIRKS